jgi:F-type H+-transporting ATPase subunit b
MFLEAAPTVVIVFLFYLLLRFTFFGPLQRVMDERVRRTEGARREAEASQTAAREKVRAYEEALRKARAAVYAEQDETRRGILEERSAKTRDARNRAMERVQTEKARIANEMAVARTELSKTTPQLAADIVRRLLERRPGAGPVSVTR